MKKVVNTEEVDLSIKQLDGVGAVTEKKLSAFGVNTLLDICIRGSHEIAEITGVSKDKADQWSFESQKILEDSGLIRKTDLDIIDLMNYQKNYPTLGTKCAAVDDLMDGGVKPEATYEVYGEFGSGKTQFCLTLVAEAISQGMNVTWIDCEDTFRVKRLYQILEARELVTNPEQGEEMLSHVQYYYTPNTELLMGTVNNLSKLMLEKRPRLVIVDGAIGQFREEYLGRGTLASRQDQIKRFMNHLKNVSYYFKCTVILTNQVQADPSMMFGDPIKAIGGNVVAHASTHRIYFKKSGKKRIARMIDSPEYPQADGEYILNIKGIDNLEE